MYQRNAMFHHFTYIFISIIMVCFQTSHASHHPSNTFSIQLHHTPLQSAILWNDLETVKSLLAQKADSNATDLFDDTPLHFALGKEDVNIEIVRVLVENKANVNATNSQETTPLHLAAFQGATEVVKLLLEKEEIDSNLKDSFQKTALDYAVEGGFAEIIPLLSPRQGPITSPKSTFTSDLEEAPKKDAPEEEKKEEVVLPRSAPKLLPTVVTLTPEPTPPPAATRAPTSLEASL